MLNLMRSSSKVKYLIFALMFLALGGLGIINDGTFMDGGRHGSVLARVGSLKITRADFDRSFSATLRQQRLSRPQALQQGLPQRELAREINSRLYALLGRDMGLVVSDDIVRKRLKSMLAEYTGQGVTEQQALQYLLRSNDMSEDSMVALLRTQIVTERMVHAIADGAQAPGQMLTDAMKYRYEWRRAAYFKITAADLDKIPDPSDDDLKAYYKTISSRFMMPEYRDFSVLVLDKEAAGGKKAPTEDDLKAYYDSHKDNYATPEQRKIAQVIVNDEAAAKKLYADARAGNSLKALAAALGKDKASYVENTYSPNDLPQELAGAFDAKETGLQEPVKSPLGWHVLDIEKITPPAVKSFDSVKADIGKALAAANDAGDALYKLAGDVDDMVGGGQNLSEVAAHYGFKLHKFKGVDAKGLDENGKKVDADGVPDFAKALDTAFNNPKDIPSQEVETSKGDFLLVQVSDIVPTQERAFDKVRADVLKDWRQQHINDALDGKATKIMESIKLGGSFDKAAEKLGKKPQMTDFVQRQEQYAKTSRLERGMVPALFSIDKVGEVTTVNGADSVTVMKLADRKIDVPKDQKDEDTKSLENLLTQSIQSDLLAEFLGHLKKKYDVKVYPDVLQDMYKSDDSAGQ
jgi:peptidyl-prolyl cis-trans isomerase D